MNKKHEQNSFSEIFAMGVLGIIFFVTIIWLYTIFFKKRVQNRIISFHQII
jgi:hypothetical protein